MNIVIVFPKKEIALKINNILRQNGYHVATVCGSGARALQAIEQLDAGIIVSGTRYVDMTYRDFKEQLPENFEMIILATPQQWQQYGEDDVVFLPTPFRPYDLVEVVGDYCYELERRRKRKKKDRGKARSIEEQGLIQQAKERMMEIRGFTESEAHRYLQKSSMDTGRSLVETAACIIELM